MSAVYALRFKAVFLCHHEKGPKLTHAAAARYLRKSKSFVQMWVQRYKETKTVDDLPDRGSAQKFSKRDKKRIISIFSKNPTLTLREGQTKLREKGLDISYGTIRRHLQTYNIKWRSTIKKPLLSETHVQKRLACTHDNIDRDSSNVIFSGESSFWARSNIKRTWSTPGDKMVQRTVKHAVKVHVWGCFSVQGFGKLYVFTDNLNADKMLKIYKKALLPSVSTWFIKEKKDWILQEDNDPKHRSRLCTEWKEQYNINQLDWLSQSPNANPIENVWAYIKNKLRGRQVFNIKQLSRKIRRIWRSLPHEYAVKLVESMPRRCQSIIDADDDWTHY